MAYIAFNPEIYKGKSIGNGQCVAFVQKAAHAPFTHAWKQGKRVKGNMLLLSGTAIATFQDGQYKNDTSGASHAAIYLGQDIEGINVLDQWVKKDGNKHLVTPRKILFNYQRGKIVNNGDEYWVIE